VAQPTTAPFTGLVRAPEPIGDVPPRHIPSPTSLRALLCVPSGVVVRARLPEPCPAATGGSGFTIETGSESAIGPIKWIQTPGAHQGKTLGCPDVSSLADLATGFEHVQRMQVVPLNRQALLLLVAAALGPMLPFFVSMIRLTEILEELAEFMV